MGLRDARRGQSIQIGFIIIFGALVILFSLYQAFAVPQQNAEAESNHQQTITQEMHDLRNAIVSVPATRSDQSVTLTLGTTYPARLFAMNPPPPAGVVRTSGTDTASVNLTLANALATEPEVGDYWDGTNRSFDTGNVVYSPNYNEYDNAGTLVYENTILYRQFGSDNLSVTGQRLVDGKRLSLVTLNGSVDRGSSTSESVTVEAVSASGTTVGITNETGENITIRVASKRPASEWDDLLRDDEQFTDQSGHVVGVTETSIPNSEFDVIEIELEGDVRYRLRMAKAGIGTRVSDETATYLTDIQGEGANIEEESTTDLVVEVRDAYNNPVSDVQVNASVEAGANTGSLSEQQATTGVDGGATVEYEAGDISGETSKTFAVNFSTVVDPGASFDRQTPENVTMNVTVQNTDGGGVGGGGGGGGGTDVSSGTASDLSGSGSQTQTFTVTLGDDLTASDDISIDLSDTDRANNNEDISYSNPSTTDPGDISLSGKTLTYSPDGSETNGDTITITVDANPSGQAGGNTYTVTFNGADGSSAQDTFSGG